MKTLKILLMVGALITTISVQAKQKRGNGVGNGDDDIVVAYSARDGKKIYNREKRETKKFRQAKRSGRVITDNTCTFGFTRRFLESVQDMPKALKKIVKVARSNGFSISGSDSSLDAKVVVDLELLGCSKKLFSRKRRCYAILTYNVNHPHLNHGSRSYRLFRVKGHIKTRTRKKMRYHKEKTVLKAILGANVWCRRE